MSNPKTEKVNWEQASRYDWSTEPRNDEGYPGHMEIIVGTMQRMANSTEVLIERDRQDSKTLSNKLARTLDWVCAENTKNKDCWLKAERKCDALTDELKTAKKALSVVRHERASISALRGVITKLKKKVKKLEDASGTQK
jgi:hypothetical protein